MVNVCMADITVWAVICSRTSLQTCTHNSGDAYAHISDAELYRCRRKAAIQTYYIWIITDHLRPPFTLTHTHTVLISSDRNTNVSKPWGQLLNQAGEKQREGRADRQRDRGEDGGICGVEVWATLHWKLAQKQKKNNNLKKSLVLFYIMSSRLAY